MSQGGQTKRPSPKGNGGSGQKRQKGDPAPSSFEEELRQMQDLEGAVDRTATWSRPPVGDINASKDSIACQWFDCDMYTGNPLKENPKAGAPLVGSKQKPVPIIRFYGVTEKGNSVLIHIHGFTPYMYVLAPPGFKRSDLGTYRNALESRVKNSNGRFEECKTHVLGCEYIENKSTLLGYQFDRMTHLIKVHVAVPTIVPTVRSIMERGFDCPGYGERSYVTYESNVPFTLRYMIDNQISGCNWIEMPAATYSLRSDRDKISRCQIEADIVYTSLISHKPEGEWSKIAPLRILSFDIECMGRKGFFPEPEHDPVIQIANTVTLQGSKTPIIRNVFTLDTCNAIPGADVYDFPTEQKMMLKWVEFLQKADPDILTGYNIQNFDVPYLLKRAKTLKISSHFDYWGRVRNSRVRMRDTTFASSAYGKRENIETTIEGRTMFDMLPYMFRNQKMSSYSLNAVSAEFLGQQKEDVHHSIISDLQRGTANDRRRLAVYCLKDAYLPQRLMDKLSCLINYVEMARVCGVTLDILLNRGQQIKVLSMLLRKCSASNLVIPVIRKESSEGGYEGATVIDPIKAFYQEPIATLDFASLYPSIMMGYNLCYSTLVKKEDIVKLQPEQYQKSPSGDVFVRAGHKKGLLPIILEEILAARKRAKADMKKATDPMEKAVQNGRQLALKVSANSVYGFTGATVGQLPCLPIASSVTAYGRELLFQTRSEVEAHYTIENGYKANAKVVYGDTDSVMINFGVPTVEETMPLAEEAAELVTKKFPHPVKLEFEKVYFPYLLMNKKRYAGLLWTNPEKYDYMDCKGLETVRRDNCLLVRRMIDKCLRLIIIDRNVEGAINYAKQTIADLLQNKLDYSMLIITKSLGKSADADDYTNKQAHVELAARMHKRDPGTAPNVGDRVAYIFIQKAKGSPAYEKSEDPIYALEHNLPIDYQYYLQNQLSKPLLRIFEPIIDDPKSLLSGEHTRSIYKPTPTARAGSIMMFAKKTEKCLACKSPISGSKAALCEHCKPRESMIYMDKLQAVSSAELTFSKLWTECQNCQGSMHQDVLCSNGDCPIFYKRKKIQKDLQSAQDVLDRFQSATSISW